MRKRTIDIRTPAPNSYVKVRVGEGHGAGLVVAGVVVAHDLDQASGESLYVLDSGLELSYDRGDRIVFSSPKVPAGEPRSAAAAKRAVKFQAIRKAHALTIRRAKFLQRAAFAVIVLSFAWCAYLSLGGLGHVHAAGAWIAAHVTDGVTALRGQAPC